MANAAAETQPPLNDLMMAMDVVDTLRHGEALVERELSGEQRRRRMIERLREIYTSQGIAVSDRILAEDGTEAAANDDAESARAAVASLEATLAELRRSFEIVVVSWPSEQSGVFRIPDDNPGARNYYLIVEAIGPDGTVLSRRITSEEDNATRTVTMWGVRVPEDVYNSVADDKRDDGIVQNDLLGENIRGTLKSLGSPIRSAARS